MLIDEILAQVGNTTNIDTAIRFQIDNVASYAYSEEVFGCISDDYTKMSLDDNHLPNIAPLAPMMWFEFGGLAKGKSATNCYGCLVSIAYDRRESIQGDWDDEDSIPENTRWVLRLQCFYRLPDGYKQQKWINFIAVGADGEFIGPVGVEWANPDTAPSHMPEMHIYREEAVALLALCFAHCKGVEIQEHHPTRQVRRVAERTGKPVITFHTIDINPSKDILRTEGHISENGIAKALHICRGHFAHYTADKPLFGKYTGTFYRPMHVRGKAEEGITLKDYRVHAEEQK